MKKIKGVSLVLENGEMICLKPSEFQDLKIFEISQDVIQIGKEMMEVDSFDYASIVLNAAANHTYNSFGEVSQQKIFDRLEEDYNPLAVWMLQYEDDTYRDLFVSSDMAQIFSPNKYGDLCIECFKPDQPVDFDDDEEDDDEGVDLYC